MLKIFKIIAFLEGASLLLLLFFAMPLKYFFNQPIYVKLIGMSHGILFIGYVILALMLKIEKKWNNQLFLTVLLASVVPFGTFYVEKKYFTDK